MCPSSALNAFLGVPIRNLSALLVLKCLLLAFIPSPLFKEECCIFLAIADLRELKLSASQMTNWSSFRLNARHKALITGP